MPVPPELMGKAPVTSEAKSTEVPSVVCKAPPEMVSPAPVKSVKLSPLIASTVVEVVPVVKVPDTAALLLTVKAVPAPLSTREEAVAAPDRLSVEPLNWPMPDMLGKPEPVRLPDKATVESVALPETVSAPREPRPVVCTVPEPAFKEPTEAAPETLSVLEVTLLLTVRPEKVGAAAVWMS